MRILLVEDDRKAAALLVRGLREEGFVVDHAASLAEADEAAFVTTHDLIVLDGMLPDGDGVTLCRTLRARGQQVPVLMLTARDALSDRVDGLNAGADDYLIKPFDLDELAARTRAMLRRRTGQKQPVYTHGCLALDPAAHEVTKDGESIALVPREFALLRVLIEQPARVFTKAELEERMYGWGEEVGSNAIEVHVHSLRRKIGTDQIVTVRGVGYRLKRAE